MDEDYNVGRLLNKIETSKFKKRPTKKVKKAIRETQVLSELEKAKKQGIIKNISAVFAVLNSGEPKMPFFNGDDSEEKMNEKLGEKVLRKLIEAPISLVLLPFVAVKMGINAVKLKKWLNEKHELFRTLEVQGLRDNIEKFSQDQKEYFKLDSPSKFIDHVLSDHKLFPNQYDKLIEGMSAEFRGEVSRQAEEDRDNGRRL